MKQWVIGAVGAALGALATLGAQWAIAKEEPVRPAYLVVVGEVRNPKAFAEGYVAKLPPIYAQYGGEYLAVGRNFELLEGEANFQSYVISKWPSMAAGRAFWNSEEYKALKDARIAGDWGRFDVVLMEGLPATQETKR
jgi:uncharacterized protein (DUF1330 family)